MTDKKQIKTKDNVCFALMNDGTPVTEFPMEVGGDFVILENFFVDGEMDKAKSAYSFEVQTEEHKDVGQHGAYKVVAIGDGNLVQSSNIKKGDFVGTPIGHSITAILHPMIAMRQMKTDQYGNRVHYKRDDFHYNYMICHVNLLPMRYLQSTEEQ